MASIACAAIALHISESVRKKLVRRVEKAARAASVASVLRLCAFAAVCNTE